MRYTNYYIPLHESLFFIDGFFSSCSFSLIIHLVLSLYSSILFFLFLLFFINPFLILLGQIYFLYLHDLIPFFIYISLYFLGIKVFYLHVSCFFLLFSSISSFFLIIFISFLLEHKHLMNYITLYFLQHTAVKYTEKIFGRCTSFSKHICKLFLTLNPVD